MTKFEEVYRTDYKKSWGSGSIVTYRNKNSQELQDLLDKMQQVLANELQTNRPFTFNVDSDSGDVTVHYMDQ